MARKRDDPFAVTANDRSLGYGRCEWESNGEQCRYPGSISRNTNGHGPWYCAAHDDCRSGAHGAQIVEVSRNYKHLGHDARDALYLRTVLCNANYRQRVRGCEARECINPSAMRDDGHFLCYLHRDVPEADLWRQNRKATAPHATDFMRVGRAAGQGYDRETA